MTFEEELINEVRAHPIVWNKWSEDYKNRLKNEKEWSIIAKNLNKTANEVKGRWRNLRDVFQKELKKVRKPRSGDPGSPPESNYSGKWPYYRHLTFLKDVMSPRPTQSNFDPNDDESQGAQSDDDDNESLAVIQERNLINQKASQSASASSLERSSKRNHNKSTCSEFEAKMLKIEEEKIKAFKEKKNEVDDEDMLFLKSLAPNFRYLNAVQKLRLKSKIQNLIADEIAGMIAFPSTSPYSAHSASILPSPVQASTTSPSYMSPPSQTRQFYESFDNDA